MARYRPYSYEQTKLIPVSYDRQILHGTFEHTLSAVIDSMGMAIFEKRCDVRFDASVVVDFVPVVRPQPL